jgi:hypothetical protein
MDILYHISKYLADFTSVWPVEADNGVLYSKCGSSTYSITYLKTYERFANCIMMKYHSCFFSSHNSLVTWSSGKDGEQNTIVVFLLIIFDIKHVVITEDTNYSYSSPSHHILQSKGTRRLFRIHHPSSL